MSLYKKNLGRKGENLAANYLRRKGYKILDQNWSFERTEIDIIALHKKLLVFVEVKTRTSDLYGYPEEAVDQVKEENMINAAEAYLDVNKWEDDIRFDIVSVIIKGEKEEIYHIEDAIIP